MKIDTKQLKWRHKWLAALALWVFVSYVVSGMPATTEARGFFWFVVCFASAAALMVTLVYQCTEGRGWGDDT